MLLEKRALTTTDAPQVPLSLTLRDMGEHLHGSRKREVTLALVFLGKDRKYCGARIASNQAWDLSLIITTIPKGRHYYSPCPFHR